jgi:hypothetical protein
MNVAVSYNITTPVVSIDNTGTNVTAQVVVTPNNFNVTVAVGPKGDQGVQGLTGPPGADGSPATNFITSVFGRTGIIIPVANDYSFSQLSGIPNTIAGYGISDAVLLSSANIWTATQTHLLTGLGVTVSAALNLRNTTAAVAGTQQNSPAIYFEGQGWKTTVTAASQSIVFSKFAVPIQGTANPVGEFQTWVSFSGATALKVSAQGTDGSTGYHRIYAGNDAGGAQFISALYLHSALASGYVLLGGVTANAQSGQIQVGGFNTGGYYPVMIANNAEVARFRPVGLLVGTTTELTGVSLHIGSMGKFDSSLGVGVTPTTAAWLWVAAGTTLASQINFAASSAPTTPNNGDFWFDGTNFKARVGGVTKTFTIA